MYLRLIEDDDLNSKIAESGFDIIDDTDCKRVRIESDYYHADIECQLEDYVEEVEAELIQWLNSNRQLLTKNMNVVYTYNIDKTLATNFRIIDTDLVEE